jgi:HEAT repeat protein
MTATTGAGLLEETFNTFREEPFSIDRCQEAINGFVAAAAPSADVFHAVSVYLDEEERDEVRAWGTTLLERLGTLDGVADTLRGLLDDTLDASTRRAFKYTRFFAMKALWNLSKNTEQQASTTALLARMSTDEKEDLLPRLGAACILAPQDVDAREIVADVLTAARDRYWQLWAALRALREFPVDRLSQRVVEIARGREDYFLESREQALQALASANSTPEIIRAVGEVLVSEPVDYLRLASARTLAQLKDANAKPDLLRALTDRNAEVRVQSAVALCKCLTRDEVVAAIVGAALSSDDPHEVKSFADALRQVDEQRVLASQLIGQEMEGADGTRAQRAQGLMLELGGWSAVQRLSQRRLTLQSLDEMLSKSEQAVQDTFESTIRQARVNFYFALAVNIVVVIVGIVVFGIAVAQLIDNPDQVVSWLVPGSAGALAVLINTTFNNPRRNARDDLTALINVNMIFLGYLRALNEIDATFKHAYMESRDFGTDDMTTTVQQIEHAVEQALAMAARHLGQTTELTSPRHAPAAPETAPSRP